MAEKDDIAFHTGPESSRNSLKGDTKKSLENVGPKEAVDDLAEPEDIARNIGFWEALTHRKRPRDPNAVATERSAFDNPELSQFYQPGPDYENLHRYDPQERWTFRE